MACFADINVSWGNVAKYARCGWIFNTHLTANLPGNLPVIKICKSVKIWQNYGHESVAPLFGPPCILLTLVPTQQKVTERHFIQYLTAHWAPVSLRKHHDSIIALLSAINWQFYHIGGHMIGHSLSQVRRRGTHCRNVYATLLTVLLFFAVFSIHFSSHITDVCTALEALMRRMYYINWHFTLHYIWSNVTGSAYMYKTQTFPVQTVTQQTNRPCCICVRVGCILCCA